MSQICAVNSNHLEGIVRGRDDALLALSPSITWKSNWEVQVLTALQSKGLKARNQRESRTSRTTQGGILGQEASAD